MIDAPTRQNESRPAQMAARLESRTLADLAFTADEFSGASAPVRLFHVPQMVPARAVTLLQGDGGSGKSLAALQLSAATVLGCTWLGQEVRRGNVLYLSAEDDRDEVHRRLDSITLDYGVDLADLAGLKVLDMTGEDAVLAAADHKGRLTPTDRWLEFVALAEAWEPVLLVIDNLADVFAGDENSRPHARQFVGLLQGLAQRLNASLLLIGHPSLAGMASGTGSSGSTAWNNSVRSRLYLTRPATEGGSSPDPDVRLLSLMKANYGPSGIEVRLRWRAGVFVSDGDAPGPSRLDRQAAEARIDQLFLDLLAAYQAQGRNVSHQPGPTYAPALFGKDPEAKGSTRRGLTDAMNRLFAAGTIRVEESGPSSRRRSRIVRAGEG